MHTINRCVEHRVLEMGPVYLCGKLMPVVVDVQLETTVAAA